jgi:hypothetical protein
MDDIVAGSAVEKEGRMLDRPEEQAATARRPRRALAGHGYELRVKQLVRNEMVRSGVSHEELIKRLARIGVRETIYTLRTKLSRGRFTAVFMLQVLEALGARTIDLEESLVDLAAQD